MPVTTASGSSDSIPALMPTGGADKTNGSAKPTISSLTPAADRLVVEWQDGVVTEYPWLWLRDHAHDDETMHKDTMQRQLFTAAIDPSLSGAKAALHEESGDLVVEWKPNSDGTTEKPSRLPVSFLAKFRIPVVPSPRVTSEKALWDAQSLGPTPSFPYQEIMDSDDGLIKWLLLVAKYGFAFASGTPATPEATEALIKRVAYIRHTIFDGFWVFEANQEKADTAYTTLELRGHTDGTYSHDAPGLQLLHCLSFDGTGGESTQVDAFRLAEDLRKKNPKHYEILSTVAVPGQYIGDGSHLMSARPILRHGPDGNLVQVSFNNYDRAPFLLPADQHIAFYNALREFDLMANDKKYQWRHVLAPGEVMLFDNWRVLHGRDAYEGRRVLAGAYINHEDFESRLRMAGKI